MAQVCELGWGHIDDSDPDLVEDRAMIIHYRFQGWRPGKLNLFHLKDKIVPYVSREQIKATSCPGCHQDFYQILERLDVSNPENIDYDEAYKDTAIEIICYCGTRVKIWFDYDLNERADWQQELISYPDPNQVELKV